MTAHALVIGGTRGVGRSIVRLFLERRATVSVMARCAPADHARIPDASYHEGDLATTSAADALARIVGAHGPPTAVIFVQRHRVEHGESDLAGEFETTIAGTARIIDAVAPRMASGGAIVAVSSVAGNRITPDQSLAYHVGKAGLEHLLRYYAVALGRSGIRVNAIAPGTIVKEENRAFYERETSLTASLIRAVPLGRLATADDIARAAWFLCSDESSFITGQTLTVDGGASVLTPESLSRSAE